MRSLHWHQLDWDGDRLICQFCNHLYRPVLNNTGLLVVRVATPSRRGVLLWERKLGWDRDSVICRFCDHLYWSILNNTGLLVARVATPSRCGLLHWQWGDKIGCVGDKTGWEGIDWDGDMSVL
jgi:hypothetical protein